MGAALKRAAWLLLAPALVYVVLVCVLPMFSLIAGSVPDGPDRFLYYKMLLTEAPYPRILIGTFLLAAKTTALCLLIGYPVAYLMTHVSEQWRRLCLFLVIVPYLTSFLVRTYAWIVILSDNGVINGTLLAMGLIDAPFKLLYSDIGVLVGMVHIMLPFMILPLYNTMRQIDGRLIRAARSLGSGPVRSFMSIFLPLSGPGIRSGCALVFVLALGFYITPLALGRASNITLAGLIEIQVFDLLDLGFAAASAVVLLALTMLVLSLFGGAVAGNALQAMAQGPSRKALKRDADKTRAMARGNGDAVHTRATDMTAPHAADVHATAPTVPDSYATAARHGAGDAQLSVRGWVMQLPPIAALVDWLTRAMAMRRATLTARGRDTVLTAIGGSSVKLVAAAVLAFLILPSLIVIPMSFNGADYLSFPPESFSLRWYRSYLLDPDWIGATWLSARIATMAAILATITGTLAAYSLFRYAIPGRRVVVALLMSPLIVPAVVLGVCMYDLFVRWHLIGSPLGLTLAHAVVAIPYVLVTVSASLSKFDPALERAASSLGATGWTTFRRITLPLIAPGVISGALFAFIHSFDEVVVSIFVSGYVTRTLPLKMWENVRHEVDPTIAAISALMMILLLLWLLVTQLRASFAQKALAASR